MSALYNLTSSIRKHIQLEYNYQDLTSSGEKIKEYKVLCSALDVVNDIDEAICSYLNLNEFEGRSINYIYIYGIINCLQSQTIAVQFIYKFFLAKALDITQNKELDIVRLLRNKIFAHSVDTDNGFGIVASTMKTFSFQPHSFQSEYGSKEYNKLDIYTKVDLLSKNQFTGDHFTIDIKELIKNHQSALEMYLQEAVNHLSNN